MYSVVSLCVLKNILKIMRVNNMRVLKIKNAIFLGYFYYMNTNMGRSFQICISVPLKNPCGFRFFFLLITALTD